MDATMIQDILQVLAPYAPMASVAGATAGVLNLLLNRAKSSREAKEQLVRVTQAIRDAIDMTDAYLLYRSSNGAPDRTRERELAHLWKIAGLELERVAESDLERTLAKKLRQKSFAWDYTGQWPEGRLSAQGLDFATVTKELRKLERALKART